MVRVHYAPPLFSRTPVDVDRHVGSPASALDSGIAPAADAMQAGRGGSADSLRALAGLFTSLVCTDDRGPVAQLDRAPASESDLGDPPVIVIVRNSIT